MRPETDQHYPALLAVGRQRCRVGSGGARTRGRCCAPAIFPAGVPSSPPAIFSLQNEEDAFRKIKLRVEDVQGRFCLTNFHGMDLTTDKLRSLIKKRCDIVEAHT